ncbi:hypothetical protein SETIT_6G066700v2 [Setaria italica]|uniref:Uncharacterized protein n=2 Tax=Setaria TaxID=4554 RepID=A0A368RIS6_SETIT|nr:hypothetical protein SETIT_6G066700v2 [Setaria italica]TKW09042.1 hypothetical protein SEVIR_6G065300v2 [Setaria viridis]
MQLPLDFVAFLGLQYILILCQTNISGLFTMGEPGSPYSSHDMPFGTPARLEFIRCKIRIFLYIICNLLFQLQLQRNAPLINCTFRESLL